MLNNAQICFLTPNSYEKNIDKKKDDLYALPRLMYEGPPLNYQIKFQLPKSWSNFWHQRSPNKFEYNETYFNLKI